MNNIALFLSYCYQRSIGISPEGMIKLGFPYEFEKLYQKRKMGMDSKEYPTSGRTFEGDYEVTWQAPRGTDQ